MKQLTPDQFRALRNDGLADFDYDPFPISNVRRAHCRICGGELAAGSGLPYMELMMDGYRSSVRYVCPICKEATK